MVISFKKLFGSFINKSRRNRRKYARPAPRGGEQFEVRTLLTNTVVASLSGSGFLNLQGDSRSNGVEIHVNEEGIFATGSEDSDTQIRFRGVTYGPGEEVQLTSSTTLSGFNADLKNGNDNLLFRVDEGTLTNTGNLIINAGSGNDTVALSTGPDAHLDVDLNLIVYGGSGNDQVLGVTDEAANNFAASDLEEIPNGSNDINVRFGITILGQSGNDIIALGGASAGGALVLDSGSGNDHVGILDAQVTSTTVINTGTGNDCFVASNLDAEGSLVVVDATGNDQFGISDSSVGGVLKVVQGSGNDELGLDNVNVDGSLVFLFGGSGHDQLQSNIDLSHSLISSIEDRDAELDFSDCVAEFAGLFPDTNDEPIATNDSATTAINTAVTVSVLTNDFDLDGDVLTPSIVTQGTLGSAVVNPNGTITYTPNLNATGTDSLTYRVSDGTAFSNIATVTITITPPPNVAPVAVADTGTTAEDTPLTVAAAGVLSNDTDADGNALTAVLNTGVSNGVLVLNSNGSYTYTPNTNFNGTDSFTYHANDGTADSNIVTVTITVTPVDDSPVANGDVAVTLEDTAITTGIVLANDNLGDQPTTITASDSASANGGVVVNNGDGTFTLTPAANFNGTDTFTYTITDADGDSSTGTVTVTVTSVNDVPLAVADAVVTSEDVAVTASVLANDQLGDPPTTITAFDAASVNGGVVVNNGDGTLTFTPAANFSGSDSFTYTITDANGETSTATVTVAISAVSDAPTALNGTLTTAEDTAATGTLVATDPDSGFLIYSIVNISNANGVVTLLDASTGAYSYVPNADFNGTASFTFVANDASQFSNVATVTITVTPVDDGPPTANADVAVTLEDTVVVTGDVLANDLLGDEPTTITASDTASANGGVVVDNGDGTFTFTPAANFNGTDTFTYTITDVDGDTSTGTVTVTVTAVNDLPSAVGDVAVTLEDTAVVSVNVLANDVLGDTPTTITASDSASVNGGVVVDNGDGTFTFTPAANFNGTDTFTYTITDSNGDSSTGTVTVTVTAVDDLPLAVDDVEVTVADTAVITADVLANDVLGDEPTTITASDTASVNGGVVVDNGDGTFTFTPAASFTGTDTFTYTITDSNGDSSTGTVTVTVTASTPLAGDDVAVTLEDTAVITVDVLANDVLGVQPTTITAFDAVSVNGGVVVDNGDGTFTFTPAADFNGTDTFTYTITDSNGNSSTGTVTVTVTPVVDLLLAIGDVAVTLEDVAIVTPDVLGNDLLGDPLTTITAFDAVSVNGGVVVDNGDNTFTFTPAVDFNGTDTFTYTITDGDGTTSTGTVTIAVAPLNDVPAAAADVAVTLEDTAVVTVDVLGNDLLGDPTATITAFDAVSVNGGVVVDNGDGTFTFTPAANFNGTDTFTYTITDADGEISTATVTITVTSVNDVPAAAADVAVTVQDVAVITANVLANDVLGDEPTTITAFDAASVNGGVVVNNGDGTFTFTPALGFTGTDTFTYTITDANGETSTATVTITVNAP